MCNCGKSRELVPNPRAVERSFAMPKSGQQFVWFYAPSIGAGTFVTNGGISGSPYYMRHDTEFKMSALDADWNVTHPDSWNRGRPNDAILARSGVEYVYFIPDSSGEVQGQAVRYVFSLGQKLRVLNVDLPAVQGAVSGTVQ